MTSQALTRQFLIDWFKSLLALLERAKTIIKLGLALVMQDLAK